MTKCGVHGATVGVAIPPSLDYVTALLAVYLAGNVPGADEPQRGG